MQTTERRDSEKALVDQAREYRLTLDQGIERLIVGMRSAAGSDALARGDRDAFSRELGVLSDTLDRAPLVLVGPDGRVLARAGISPLPIGASVPAPALAAIGAGNVALVTNLLSADGMGRREIAIAVPGPSSRIVALIDSRYLSVLLGMSSAPGDDLVLTVRDRDGVVVARSVDGEASIGQPAREGFAEAIAGHRSGILPDLETPEGVPVIRAFSVSKSTGYAVVASQPYAAFSAVEHREVLWMVLVGVFLLAAGVSAAVALSSRLVRALHQVGQGQGPIRPSGLREVDELALRLSAAAADRDAAAAAVRDSEARLRELVGTLDLAAIMTRELDGTIRFWSHGCAQLYGWSPNEALGRSSHELLRTQFPVPLPQIEHDLLTKGEWKGDLVHRRRDGRQIVIAAHKALKRDVQGKPHMVMESLIDVTALRDAQKALREMNENLETRIRTEIAARETAQVRAMHADRIRALGQLAGGIAHDFNNVLQAIAGGAALIARKPDDAASVTRLISVVSDAATRGASITRRMLLLARQGDLQPEPVEANAMLAGLREVFSYTLGVGIATDVEVEVGLPRLMADKAQLETALVNLATNARDAMRDGGRLRLLAGVDVIGHNGAAAPGGLPPGVYVRLTVTDNGIGMDSETLGRLGEPFFTTKGIGQGTGLGVSMVKGFAEQSGGAFVIESAPGEGTRAMLWLPAVPGDSVTVGGAEGVETSRRTGRILLVDDDRLVRDTITEQLQELGHKVLAAASGTDALAILRAREAVDVMITDLSMPGMDGLTLIREALGLRPGLPAILLTGFTGETSALESRGISREAYALMRKPASSASLNAQVMALLQRP